MREEDYGGGMESKLWFEARTNCMRLQNRRWEQEDKSCKMCGHEEETMEHFILDCGFLEEEREQRQLSCKDQDWRMWKRY